MDIGETRVRPPGVIATAGVCFASAGLALVLGFLAAIMYHVSVGPVENPRYNRPREQLTPEIIADYDRAVAARKQLPLVALSLPPVSGAVVAILWHWRMRRRMIARPHRDITRFGALTGAAAGVVSTMLVHAGFMLACRTLEMQLLSIGLLVGILAGALLGAACGAAYERRRRAMAASLHAPPSEPAPCA